MSPTCSEPSPNTSRRIAHVAINADDDATRVTLRYHYFYPHQYDLLFGLTGFRLLGLLGDYDDTRFDEDSERLIVVGEAE